MRPVELFLDFDGVLHPMLLGETPFKDEQLAKLKAVLTDYPEVVVVVSSSWRMVYSDDELYDFIAEAVPPERFGGSTPREIPSRWESIDAYRMDNDSFSHVILDDSVYSFPTEAKEHLIAPESKVGMSDDNWADLRKRLDAFRADPEHRFKWVWPGNYCIDCGLQDPIEQANIAMMDCLGDDCKVCNGKKCTVDITMTFPPCVRKYDAPV